MSRAVSPSYWVRSAVGWGVVAWAGCTQPSGDEPKQKPGTAAVTPAAAAPGSAATIPSAAGIPPGGSPPVSTKPAWPILEPEGEGFSIELPGRPEPQLSELDTPAGKVFVRLYSLADDEAKRVYHVTVSKFAAPPAPGEVKRVLDRARDGALKLVGGIVTAENEIQYGDYPGRALTVSLEGGAFLHSRLVVADERLYQANIVSPVEELSADDRRVFDSLRIGRARISISRPPLAWRVVTPEGSTFAVEMPNDPQEQVGLLNTPLGRVDLRRLEVRVAGRTYFAQSCDVPLVGGTATERLDAARDHLLRESGGTAESETPVTLDGSEGREVIVNFGDRTMRLRTYLDGPRVYQIGVVAAGAQTDEDRRFFNSLRLSERSGK